MMSVAGVLVAGCASPDDPEVSMVEITGTGFSPILLEVASGTEVRWTNLGPQAHTVRAGGPLPEGEQALPEGAEGFDSGRLVQGETFAHVFETAGDYYYECEYHGSEQMVGTIRVVEP